MALDSASYDETLQLASRVGANLHGGELFELVSDLGGGKTAFVAGLARGMGSTDPVSSPSFTINQIYRSGNKFLNHYDLYRLKEPGIMKEEILEALRDPSVVVAIEWAETVRDILPDKKIKVAIETVGENSRKIILTAPAELAYSFKGVES